MNFFRRWRPRLAIPIYDPGDFSGGMPMKAFLAACVIIVVLAVCSSYVLDMFQEPAQQAFASPTGVKL